MKTVSKKLSAFINDPNPNTTLFERAMLAIIATSCDDNGRVTRTKKEIASILLANEWFIEEVVDRFVEKGALKKEGDDLFVIDACAED